MRRWIRRLGNLRRQDRTRGQSLVEFGLVLPIFILVLIGIMDLSMMFFNRMTVINATREGVRVGVTYTNQDMGEPTASPELLHQDFVDIVEAQVMGHSGGVLTTDNSTIVVQCPGVTGGCENAERGDTMRVQVNYTYRPLFPLWFGPGIAMELPAVDMRME